VILFYSRLLSSFHGEYVNEYVSTRWMLWFRNSTVGDLEAHTIFVAHRKPAGATER
jgi:hypothetical protein